ncbi:acetyl-CoA C-acyltransferase family protein [Marinobacter nauticus]|uniref:Acetyl-CoA acetyltransferase n=1 Tax=Marinobacter nauticus TaxID=2743 RepID=A0A1M2USS7_MARNT|nr:acetyl-CoA C-acyltransferase family protein [Marinobacter nauticus]OJS98388.1 acetyl-CoA acetyltransferase [Marinobacter nauticus]
MAQRQVFVASAVRTAVGSYGGSLKDYPLADLATLVVRNAVERAGVDTKQVGHVVMGNVVPTEPGDAYLSRVAAIGAGVPMETPSFNVNRLCGSGLQAVISAAQSILLGDTDVAVGAGAESMSRGPYIVNGLRWGARLGNIETVDYMNGILHDPWKRLHMGVTAENVATRYGIEREEQDALALESQKRAAKALTNGYFDKQIIPVEVRNRKGVSYFTQDENVRADVTAGQLAAMKPVFVKENGTVTAGNASSLNDGAAALVLIEGKAVEKMNVEPLARLVGYAHAGVDPDYMGIGPVPAVLNVLKKTGIELSEIDVIEANEAFAAQACAVIKELGLDPEIVNPNGSGISLGHPVGATGAIISTKAIHELLRIRGRYALVTMCIGGGQGIAAIYQRV